LGKVSILPSSLGLAVEDRQQVIQRLIHPTKVPNVAPVDGVWVVAEMVVGQLLQPGQLDVDGGGAGEIGVDGSGLGVHRWAPCLVDDATIHALNDQEAKLFLPGEREETARKTHNLGNKSIFVNVYLH